MPKTLKVTKAAVKKVAAKKVATKKVTKSPVKKVAAKKSAKPIVVADNEKSFWLSDGQILNSLVALSEALKEMEQEVFAHHVDKNKNDFADWVDLVLADDTCAQALRKTKTPKSAHTVVLRHLKVYQI